MAKDDNTLKRVFDLYTSDLSFEEIQKLIKRESAEVYQFFAADIPKDEKSKNKFSRSLIFARNLFNAFLLKLKPARRIFYLIALLFILVGYSNANDLYIILSFLILNFLLAFELADKLTTKDEIELAKQIQSDLIPKSSPENKFYDFATYYESAREVGGDYFDIIKPENGDDKTYLVIGDISGKGLPAALYMVRVQAILQSLITNFNNVYDILINLKKYFSRNLRKEYFLTIIAASIDKRGGITFCSAGHTPVLHYKSSSKTVDELNPKGIGIGLNDKGIFEANLEKKRIIPKKGDLLLFYTDGITEAMNKHKVQFGLDSLKRIVEANANKSAYELKELILKSINQFIGDVPNCDDITLIVLKKK